MNLDLVFGALADPTRRAIVDRLRAGDLSSGDLAEPLPISRPAVSQHLKVLEGAGLIAFDAVHGGIGGPALRAHQGSVHPPRQRQVRLPFRNRPETRLSCQ